MRTRRPAPRGDPAGRRERLMGSGAWSALEQTSLCFQGPTCRRMPAALALCRRLAVPVALPLWEELTIGRRPASQLLCSICWRV